MTSKLYSRIILAIFISGSLIACKGKQKTEEQPATTDTTATTKTASTPGNDMENMDAVKMAPNLYKVVADTLGIRILDVTYKPGDSSVMHWHPDNAVYFIDGGTSIFYGKDGSKMVMNVKPGMAAVRGAETHSVKNTGKTTVHVLLVEVRRTGAVTPPDPKTDATIVAKGLYTPLADSLGIRILKINYKPGQQSAMHTHNDAAFYALADAKAEFTGADGKKQIMDIKKGTMMITPAVTHSVKNLGKAPMQGILVEVNRAMN